MKRSIKLLIVFVVSTLCFFFSAVLISLGFESFGMIGTLISIVFTMLGAIWCVIDDKELNKEDKNGNR